MSEALSVADVLDRAADLIEPEGAWTAAGVGRDFPKTNGLPTCIGHAIEQCAKGQLLNPYFDALYAVAPFGNVSKLIRWNDAPERTHGEAVELLREAAAKAREQST